MVEQANELVVGVPELLNVQQRMVVVVRDSKPFHVGTVVVVVDHVPCAVRAFAEKIMQDLDFLLLLVIAVLD